MAKRLFRRLGLVFCSFLVALLVLELAARIVLPSLPPRGQGANLNLVVDVSSLEAPGLYRNLRPRAHASAVYPADRLGPERQVHYRTNSHGFRGPEVRAARTPGVERWAILGDSFVFGTGVNEADTLPDRLQVALANRVATRRVEVWNWGVYAYNAAQSVALLKRLQPRLEPDAVLFVLYINDASGLGITNQSAIPENWRARWIRRLGLTSGIWGPNDPKTQAQSITMGLRKCSRALDHLAHRIHRTWIGEMTRANYHRDWTPGSPGFVSVRNALREAGRLAQERNFHLEVTMYPDLLSLGPPYVFEAQHRAVAKMCADLGIVYHDLLPAFEGLDGAQLVTHTHDHHPSGETNRIAAEYLADRLRREPSTLDLVMTRSDG